MFGRSLSLRCQLSDGRAVDNLASNTCGSTPFTAPLDAKSPEVETRFGMTVDFAMRQNWQREKPRGSRTMRCY